MHHPKQLVIAASALAATLATIDASAANPSTLGPIVVKPAFHSAGLRVSVTGDDNGNAGIAVSYVKAGSAQPLQGHAPVRLSGGRAVGNLFYLSPDTEYKVTLTLTDPDNSGPVSTSATFRTRADLPPTAKGGALYVNAATGDDSNAGTQASPFKTIQRAANTVTAGMTVHVAPGVYRETVTIGSGHGGTPDNPVWFLAAPGAVIDGSVLALEDGKAFQHDGGGIYSAPFQGSSTYVAVDDVRLYDYPSLSALQAGTAGISGGFFVDKAAGRMRVKLPAGDSPASHKLHVARFPTAITLDSVSDVVVEGFDIRYFGTVQYSGTGVDLRNTSRSWIRKNHVHHMNEGVRLRQGGADNVVELNDIHDSSVWTWPWSAVKNHTPEATAVTVSGGAGTVVRRNTTHGNFNGVYVGSFDDSSEALGADTDVYENAMSEHGDDGFEPEGACVNVRFWNNRIRGMHNGISLAPIEVGPLWVVRNLLDGYKANALKVNNGPTGWMLVYHNTSVPATASSQAMAPTVAFSRLVTRNNIWAAHRYVIESNVSANAGVDFDYDDVYTDSLDGTPRFVKWAGVRYDTMAQLKASNTIEKHGFSVAPKYENASAGDFTLVEGSPLIDVGAVIPGINDQGFAGSAPDVGAFERGVVTPPEDDAGTPPGAGGSTGTGGSGEGGSPGAGGDTSLGGAPGAGGDTSAGAGGSTGHDAGAPDASAGGNAGASGNGGAPGSGGATGTGGSAGTAAGTGGTSATAGAPGHGGAVDGGTSDAEPGPAVIDDQPEDPGGGGCATSAAPGGPGAWAMMALAAVTMLRKRTQRR